MKASAMIEVTETYDVDTPERAAAFFKETHGRYPDFIDNRILNGVCIDCGKVLFEDQKNSYVMGSEGEIRCVKCAVDKTENKPEVPVKREEKVAEAGNWLV